MPVSPVFPAAARRKQAGACFAGALTVTDGAATSLEVKPVYYFFDFNLVLASINFY
jgi:hypothetical protein